MNGPPARKPSPPGRRASIALAVAVHVLLALFLIYGVHWQSERPEAVEVELVTAVPAPAAAPPPPPPEPPPPPKPEPKPEPKIEPKPPPPPRQADIVRKEEKPKKETPKPPAKQEPRPAFNPFQQQIAQEEQNRKTQQMIADDQKQVGQQKAAQAKSARDKAVGDYLSKIRDKIRGNVVLPPDIKGNPEAVFEVTQLPSGEILGVKLKTTSGQPALDAAIERAIHKSSPLPKPDQPGLLERILEIRYKPLED